MARTFVAGVGMTRFAKHADRDLASLAREATAAALSDAALQPSDVEMVFFANAVAGVMTGQETIRGQVYLAGTGLEGIATVNVDNACGAGGSAVQLASMAVASGHCDVALAVGAEKLYHPDMSRAFAAMRTGVDVELLPELERAYGGAEEGTRSFMLDLYADLTAEYMAATGADRETLAQVAAKSHDHGALNPNAQYRERVTPEQVLASRHICGPFTLLMCTPFGDGAAAVVVTGEERVANGRAKRVEILASKVTSGGALDTARARIDAVIETGAVARAARAAYEAAGIGPGDVDVVELHDTTSSAELILYEQLGLCPRGEGPSLARTGATRLGGRVPVNTSGGLVSKGHPVGATGCAQIVELVTQLRGRAGERQVEGATLALAQNAGGRLHPDDAAAVVTILTADIYKRSLA